MLHPFRFVVGTIHSQPLLGQHYSPHPTVCRTCALKVLAHASQVPLWLTANGKGQIEITVHGARPACSMVYTVL